MLNVVILEVVVLCIVELCEYWPGFNVIKKITNVDNKLECFSLAGLSSLVECLRVSPEPTKLLHSRIALLALPTNIRPCLKGLQG
jgi:hypothetical protein